MAKASKPVDEGAGIQPSTSEHGVWGYTGNAVGGFGASYDAQVAHGEEQGLPEGAPEDATLADAVRKSLAHAHIDSADVRIDVRAGNVVLYGSVHLASEKAQLEQKAQAVPGVLGVTSRLSVLNDSVDKS